MEREQRDLGNKDLILKAFNRRGYKKGSRSIKMVLKNEFKIVYSLKRIRRIMNKYEIICPYRKSNPYKKIAKATKEHRVVKNILNREFKQATPGKVLLTDITYLRYGDSRMAYLSTIKDSSTNEILAYQTSDRITLDIALDTIKNLVKTKRITLTKDTFIHSDQGSHYTSPIFQKLLRKHKLGQSMSRRGNCWDNAPQESFFGHMKDEIDLKSCINLNAVKKMIKNYITYYNNYRYQWDLKKMTPV
jgi:putative transposase